MKKQTVFFIISLLLTAFTMSCGDDDDLTTKGVNDPTPLLPTLYIDTYNLNADPFYDHVDTTFFEYDDDDRLVRMVYNKWQTYYTETTTELAYKSVIDLVYEADGSIRQTSSIAYVSEEGDLVNNTNTYRYRASETAVSIIINDTYESTMEIENGRVVKYNQVTLSIYDNSTLHTISTYTYDKNGNMLQEHVEYVEYDFYKNTSIYEYDNYNGIFKHVNSPQWLMIAILNNNTNMEGHLFNNIKLTSTIMSDDNATPLTTYEYENNEYGYPTKKTAKPDSNWDGIWGCKSTIEYKQCQTRK